MQKVDDDEDEEENGEANYLPPPIEECSQPGNLCPPPSPPPPPYLPLLTLSSKPWWLHLFKTLTATTSFFCWQKFCWPQITTECQKRNRNRMLLKTWFIRSSTSSQHPSQSNLDQPLSENDFFGSFLLRLRLIKRSQVISMGKFGPVALNFG